MISSYILVFFIYTRFIYCSYLSCISENNPSNCSSHTIDDFPNFKCIKTYTVYYDYDTGEEHCTIYPKNESDFPMFKKLFIGQGKEDYCSSYIYSAWQIFYTDSYEINGEKKNIPFNVTSFSEEDIKMIESHNICSYKFDGENTQLIFDCYSGDKEKCDYYHIKSADICYNTHQFDDLKDLVNCGYAEIKLKKKDGKEVELTTCGYVPGIKLGSEWSDFFSYYFIHNFMVNRYLHSIYGINYKDEISDYDLVVTDKNGNKFQLKGNKDGIINNDNNNFNKNINVKLFNLLIIVIFIY